MLYLALSALRERLHFSPISQLLPEKFTKEEQQLLYETIMDVKLDSPNFAKR
ncbi:NrtR DNA-binding winged helix domain-containing protein [Prevotella sp.]|uniref:NrtR DNA-binding winged helix domain-containing protein n=1 Tax=Prevotella sp. TaxID=59823 RepID=UPI0027E274BE|nr:hypothetical protein [Prevotella sp.]